MVSVGRIVEGAFDLIRQRFGAVAIWSGVYLAMSVVMMLTLQPLFADIAAPTDGVPIGPDSRFSDRMGLLSVLLPIYGMNLLLMLVGVLLYTAAMRAVLRPDAASFGYIRLGGDELRAFVLLLLFGIAAFVVTMGWGILLGIVIAATASGTGSPILIGILPLVTGVAALGITLFFVIRLSLAFPLTLHRKRIVIGEAWRLSKGRFWTLFGSALVVMLIGGVLAVIAGIMSNGSYFADLLAASGDSEQAGRAAQAQMGRLVAFSPAMILQSIVGAVVGAIWFALSGGSAATAARLILAGEFDEDAETVFG